MTTTGPHSRRRRLGIALAASTLALLAGSAAWTRVLAARAEADLPPHGSFVEADGLRLRYVERGSGVPIVLIHGAYGGLEDWELTILDDVARRGRAIAIDRPGHGYSERPASGTCSVAEQARILHAALVRLGVERAVVVGFSYGGAVAVSYALQFPAATAGLMTVNGALYEWDGITAPSDVVASVPVLGALGAWTVATPIAVISKDKGVARAFSPAPVDPRFASSSIRLALRPSALLANAQDMRLLKPALRLQSPRYGELAMPVAIVTGLGDLVTGPQFHSYRLQRTVPGSVIHPVEGSGHQILFTNGRAVVDALDELLARVSAAER